jgi:hypothetical protein
MSSSGQLGSNAIGDLAEWQNGIDAARLDRGDRHARNDRRFPILGEAGSAGVMNGAQAARTVAPHTSQDDTDAPRAVHLRDGAE